MASIDRLYLQWHSCWCDLPVSSAKLDAAFERLVAAYSHRDRHYHNLQHIESMLATLARFDRQEPIVLNLATWFHDFIYDPHARDNEIHSAIAARECLLALDVPHQQIDRVEQLILATQGHCVDPSDRDLCIFLDADLAILGADAQTYRNYAQAIRREYSWVADEDYRSGRSRVLTDFLQRDRLYHTELLFNELETAARANLDREIGELS